MGDVRDLRERIQASSSTPEAEVRKKEKAAADVRAAIDNLTEFVMKGDTSKAIRQSREAKEHELEQLQQEISSLLHPRSEGVFDVTEEWVRAKLSDLCGLLNSVQTKVPQIRAELRNPLDDQIIMTPTGTGRNRHYVATVRGRPLAILKDHPKCQSEHSATGIRTVTDTCVEARIVMGWRLSPGVCVPELALVA